MELIHQEQEKKSHHKYFPISPSHPVLKEHLSLCLRGYVRPTDPPTPTIMCIFSSHTELTSQLDFKDQNAFSVTCHLLPSPP